MAAFVPRLIFADPPSSSAASLSASPLLIDPSATASSPASASTSPTFSSWASNYYNNPLSATDPSPPIAIIPDDNASTQELILWPAASASAAPYIYTSRAPGARFAPNQENDPLPFDYSLQTCVMLFSDMRRYCLLPAFWFWLAFGGVVNASLGDRLPEFKECVRECIATNCNPDGPSIALQNRLLLWTCPSECDYTCQHIITDRRLARDPPYLQPVLQFHGKWPFYRFLGMQEPFSVLFSLLNFLGHQWGLRQLRARIPARYGLRSYYLLFGYFGLASWIFSMIFHTRDFALTEKLDYFAAGASVLYSLYYAPIRIFRWDHSPGSAYSTSTSKSSIGSSSSKMLPPRRKTPSSSLLRPWTILCLAAYTAHVSYLSFVTFDYTYNMAANVVVGILSNIAWTSWSIYRYRKTGKTWMLWPAFIVAWISAAMSLELFDFPPYGGMLDAHSLWHLGTVVPVFWWYQFLLKDAEDDLQKERLKA